MLGLEGVAVPLGFLLSIMSTVLCAVYGFVNWNRGDRVEELDPCNPQWEGNETARNICRDTRSS